MLKVDIADMLANALGNKGETDMGIKIKVKRDDGARIIIHAGFDSNETVRIKSIPNRKGESIAYRYSDESRTLETDDDNTSVSQIAMIGPGGTPTSFLPL